MRQFYELFPFLENMQQAVAQTESGITPQLAAQIVPQVGEEKHKDQIVPQVGEEILSQVGAKIFMVPRNHVKCILDKCGNDQGKALFYIEETIRNNSIRFIWRRSEIAFPIRNRPITLNNAAKKRWPFR